ncbi:hypothetical protein OG787_45875 [Streptomyces sp. NBC_00075]|uniref:hypothetical protein n=1 Tax=Streptomyces sp. NBC_00075 TaxID=2975641 RepID=UPI0032543ED2
MLLISSARHGLRRLQLVYSGPEIDPASDDRPCWDFVEPPVISPVREALLAIRLAKAGFVHQLECKLLRHTNENLGTGRSQEVTQESP